MSHPAAPHLTEPAPRHRRSLFGNYVPPRDPPPADPASPNPTPALPLRHDPPDVIRARCFLAQFLARAFEYPSLPTWDWLGTASTHLALHAAARTADHAPDYPLRAAADQAAAAFASDTFAAFHDAYVSAIGHAARGSCPINEIEYGELKADPLFQPHRLADLAAFYRAFGVELTPDGGERQDHLGTELEFLAVLAAQQEHAAHPKAPDEFLALNLDAQRNFLREHLGRWSPTFARRLGSITTSDALRAAAGLLLAFVTAECHRAQVLVGGADVTLRPADEEAALCDSCGLHQLLPGQQPTPESTAPLA